MLNRVVPDAEVFDAAMAMAKALAQGARAAQGEAKRLILTGVTESLETQMEYETRAIARMADSADGREGIAAFTHKRRANFQ